MRVIIQRSLKASVSVNGVICGEIGRGLVLLVGVTNDDCEDDIDYLVNKIISMRIFNDYDNKMNESLIDKGYSILSISQFTLFANTRKGNRPSFTDAASSAYANKIYDLFNLKLVSKGISVQTGMFGEDMQVTLVNDGPVTIIIDSKNK